MQKTKKIKNITLLGSTGSIGRNALDVIRKFPKRFRIIGLSANKQIELLAKQIKEFQPKQVCITNPQDIERLKSLLSEPLPIILTGEEGLLELADNKGNDILLNALVGAVGLKPTLKAIRNGKDIALANKETLVMAGELIMQEVHKYNIQLLPIDSEHSAIWQCLQGHSKSEIKRIILTASGGSFRNWTKERLEKATLKDALKHPTWNMGAKITIDSATLMNKGLEIIEAHWLFDIPLEKIDVIIHPQSIIHSLVEFNDGSILAQLSVPDMRIPIQYALTYPEHLNANFVKNDFFNIANLTFEEPNYNLFT